MFVREKYSVFLRATEELKEIKEQAKCICPLNATVKGVKAVLAELKAFMKKKMGPCKCMIERLITKSPINCKHNPYYAGSFNGNDCIWLVENASFIFDSLEDKFRTDKQLKDIILRFCEICVLWQSILPAIRAAHKLSPKAIEQLESDIKSFCEAYVKNTKGTFW